MNWSQTTNSPSRELGTEGTRCARPDDPADAELLHRPDVRTEVDLGGRKFVSAPVSRDESDASSADRPYHRARGRLSEGGCELDFIRVLEELVEPRSSENADLSFGHGVRLVATPSGATQHARPPPIER